MARIAVFVDAGYLFAQGSAALTGSTQKRIGLSLDEGAALAALLAVAQEKADGVPLLRVYWYDGALGHGGPTLEQEAIANCDNVKLRLGFINKQGQQKGVDSLIVTDLIDLARNHAISDALLMSGDEDVRIGVEISQGLGVRVHLLGIVPSRGSQSKQLLLAADTTTEWDRETVSTFLKVTSEPQFESDDIRKAAAPATSNIGGGVEVQLAHLIAEIVPGIDDARIGRLYEHFSRNSVVPPEYDRPLLARARDTLGRDLTNDERSHLRRTYKESVRGRVSSK